MSSPGPSQPTLPTLASRLVSIRQKLVTKGLYLGHQSVRDNVMWQRIGRANHVIEAMTDLSSSTTPEAPEIASLSAVVRISSNGYYLTSDGNYRPGGRVYKHLSEVRPSCFCEAPTVEPFKSDFERVLENLRWLQEQAVTPGFGAKVGLFPAIPNMFKVRHVLFDAKRLTSEDGTVEGTDESPESASDEEYIETYTIDNWPVSPAVEGELEGMKQTHIVIPIPAYDLAGNLINPRSYRSRLEGALVELKFNLLHWSIGAKKSESDKGREQGTDAYVADIDRIWVLAPPPSTPPSSPRKRKVPDTINTDLSPTKKRAVA